MEKMNILVTGSSGMVGKALVAEMEKQNIEFIPYDITANPDHDIADFEKVKKSLLDAQPSHIIHLAAMTNVDDCEKYPELAYKINSIGTKNLAIVSGNLGIPMLYMSTGAVFDGTSPVPYTEFDIPNPISIYGKSKYFGEQFVREFNRKYYIARTGYVFGGGVDDHKFVAKMIDLMKTRKKISVVNDKFGSPSYTKDISQAILKLLNTNNYGMYHAANEGFCSRYEYALAIKEYSGLKEVEIEPVSSAFFPLPAPRPMMEALSNLVFILNKWNRMRSWKLALEDYIQNELGY